MMASKARSLLIISLGNPHPKYSNTLHSAGHNALFSLRQLLGSPPLTHYGASSHSWVPGYGSESRIATNTLKNFGNVDESLLRKAMECDWRFVVNSSLMNVSGPGVSRTWKRWCQEKGTREGNLLIVVHDEMNIALGKIVVGSGWASPR